MSRALRRIIEESSAWISAGARGLPGGLGRSLRRLAFGRGLARLGARSSFDTGIIVTGGKNISIGDDFAMLRNGSLYAHDGEIRIGDRVSMNSNVCVGAADGGRIVIGSDVLIGPNAVLRASDHIFSSKNRPMREQGHTGGEIIVGDDVWLGANIVIVAGVAIGAHSVVAAGAVVTRNVEPWSVVAGVPARVISRR